MHHIHLRGACRLPCTVAQGWCSRESRPFHGARRRRGTCVAAAPESETFDIVSKARQKVNRPQQLQRAPPPPGPLVAPLVDFSRKLRAAWQIFFPPPPAVTTPKEEGKNRLRMILVADRCGMNAASLFEMKHSIVRAVSEYVDIEAEELVDVNVTMDSDLGTIYSVAVPVRRVKPVAQVPMSDIEAEGITLTWEPEDENADPSVRFPYGT